MTDREALTFRITDQSEAAIRSRADQSVLWNEDEGNVPTRIADALWAAVRDRESLLTTLDRERAAGVHLGDEGLDAAWAKAEAAMPEGWTGPFVGPHHRGDYWANAWLTAGGRPYEQQLGADNLIVASHEAHGDTPAAALSALSARLTEGEPDDH